MLDTFANAQLYRAAGFTEAQVDALVERDRKIEAAREASSQPSSSQRPASSNLFDTILANHWRLSLVVAMIVIVGFCDTMFLLALKSSIGH